MKTSLALAVLFVLGSGAVGVGAIVSPYLGSNALYNFTNDELAVTDTPYVGGGDTNAELAMVNRAQLTAPMARMMENQICGDGNPTEASGIVIGLEAVDLLSSIATGASTACNSAGGGLIRSGGASNLLNWKSVLKLVYFGEPNPADNAYLMCNGPLRTALVSNWTNLFQNGCANAASTCSAAPQNGQLWHAFRLDDGSDQLWLGADESSGNSDAFASLIGGFPVPSASALNGFGTSPYCNAMNWDTGIGNGTTCANGRYKQFVGPGGVADANAADNGLHRTPPPGTWGTTPFSGATVDADVLPTSMQDNDPIRRKCLGSALGTIRAAEDVCNLDGSLGLVLAIPATEQIQGDLGFFHYPIGDTNGTGAYVGCSGESFQVSAPGILTCAPQSSREHNGQCPDGDSALFGGGCLVKAAASFSLTTGFGTLCLASPSQIPTIQVTPATVTKDGRVQNMFLFDGTNGGGYLKEQIPSPTGPAGSLIGLDAVLGIGRIHSVSTIPGSPSPVQTCTLHFPSDQVGCLVQADPWATSRALLKFEGGGSTGPDRKIGVLNPKGTADEGHCQETDEEPRDDDGVGHICGDARRAHDAA